VGLAQGADALEEVVQEDADHGEGPDEMQLRDLFFHAADSWVGRWDVLRADVISTAPVDRFVKITTYSGDSCQITPLWVSASTLAMPHPPDLCDALRAPTAFRGAQAAYAMPAAPRSYFVPEIQS